MFTGEDSEEEEDPDMETIPMQGEDGQHYVVLEVIHLPDDGSGTGQGVVQIAGGGGTDFNQPMNPQGITILPSILEEEHMPDMQNLDEELQPHQSVSQEDIRIKKEQERANCFGFDDEFD